ncbi:MAG: hypothetical protein AMXMBFR7_26880 [Planctomycetota bacterium]
MSVYKRNSRAAGREIRRALSARNAAEALGEITRGCEIYGLSKGQFSLVDIIEHCLKATGPADVVLSTWTAAGADIDFALALLRNGSIRSMRFIVDFSFPTRQPAYCAALRERFGDDAIRLTKTHAKFVTITNTDWNLVIRSSMNLNENRRLESFEISDDAGMAAYLREVCQELFDGHAAGKQFAQRPFDVCKDFESFGESEPVADAERKALAGDGGKYFNDGPTGTDLRRAGWTTAKGKGLE